MFEVGIVGCCGRGLADRDAVAAHDDVALSVACDGDGERARTPAAGQDCCAVTDHRERFHRTDVDVVHVAVPSLAHRKIVGDALAAGTQVLCEKPIAEGAATGEEMVAHAEASDAVTP